MKLLECKEPKFSPGDLLNVADVMCMIISYDRCESYDLNKMIFEYYTGYMIHDDRSWIERDLVVCRRSGGVNYVTGYKLVCRL